MLLAEILAAHTLFSTDPALASGQDRIEADRASAGVYSSVRQRYVGLTFKTLAPRRVAEGVTAVAHYERRNESLLVHRIVMDTANGLYYGYDVEVVPASSEGQYRVSIRPLDASADTEFREREWSDHCRGCRAPRSVTSPAQRFPGVQTLALGDALTIDLLADETTGEPISEEVRMAPKPSSGAPKTSPARDLRAESVWMQLDNLRLLVDGVDAYPGSTGSAQTEILQVVLPGRGRAILSLAPRKGYAFQRIGVVAGDRITFSIGDSRYQLLSNSPIVTSAPAVFRNVQSWFVWVLHDPDYVARDPGWMAAGFDERAENTLRRPE